MPPRVPVLAAVIMLTAAAAGEAGKGLVADDPAKAGPDFAVQGEYLAAGTPALAAQVVAQGSGAFIAVLLAGGLPGAGWDGAAPVTLKGATSDGATAFAGDGWKGSLRDGALALTAPDGTAWTLARHGRQSPTLGLAPPPGATVVFDGSGTAALAQGVIDARGLLSALIPGSPRVAAGPVSKATFQDATIHLEFRTPFMPAARGQARGNSGVYVQERYELQVLDSFGMRHGNPQSIGDICGEVYKVALPKVNACLPPLTWQTYDIEFTAARRDAAGAKTAPARVTLRHNGILVHENVDIPKPTGGGKPESPAPGPLMLQHHDCPVVYRNVWILAR